MLNRCLLFGMRKSPELHFRVLSEVTARYVLVSSSREGEFIFVASREKLEQAAHLVQGFRAHWHQEYVVRDSNGNDADPEESATHPECRGLPPET